jgi:hypothetical protein
MRGPPKKDELAWSNSGAELFSDEWIEREFQCGRANVGNRREAGKFPSNVKGSPDSVAQRIRISVKPR